MSGPAGRDPADRDEPSPQEVESLFTRLDREAESSGYHLNPDRTFTLGLVRGMLVNERRHGYWACPCRLASGVKKEDLDIICPCDYRDDDLAEHGACYCGLYVTKDVVDGKRKLKRVPERRPPEEKRLEAPAPAERMSAGERASAGERMPPAGTPAGTPAGASAGGSAEPSASAPPLESPAGLNKYPLWRCRVCGYLCARGQPPEVCPICKAKKERFERLL